MPMLEADKILEKEKEARDAAVRKQLGLPLRETGAQLRAKAKKEAKIAKAKAKARAKAKAAKAKAKAKAKAEKAKVTRRARGCVGGHLVYLVFRSGFADPPPL
jgi:FKBP-type peptidyl-prolyl cis-trans isomerase